MSNTQRITIFVVLSVAAVAIGVGSLVLPDIGKTHEARVTSPSPIQDVYESIPAVPQRTPEQDDATWHAELKVYACKWREFLTFRCSHEEKILRSYELLEVLSQAMSDCDTPEEKTQLRSIITTHENVITSLADPQKTLEQALSAYRFNDLRSAISLLEFIVLNPNYDCPDVKLLLAYCWARILDLGAALFGHYIIYCVSTTYAILC